MTFEDIPGAVVKRELAEQLRVTVPYERFPAVNALLKDGDWRVTRSGPAVVGCVVDNEHRYRTDSSVYEVHAWRPLNRS